MVAESPQQETPAPCDHDTRRASSWKPGVKRKWPVKLELVDIYNEPIKSKTVRHKCIFKTMPNRKTPDGREMLNEKDEKMVMTCAYRSGRMCRRRRRPDIVVTATGDCPLRKPIVIRKPIKPERKGKYDTEV